MAHDTACYSVENWGVNNLLLRIYYFSSRPPKIAIYDSSSSSSSASTSASASYYDDYTHAILLQVIATWITNNSWIT